MKSIFCFQKGLFWCFLEKISEHFETLPRQLVDGFNRLVDIPKHRILNGRWLEICADIVILFFEYFDPNVVVEAYVKDQSTTSNSILGNFHNIRTEGATGSESAPILLIRRLSASLQVLVSNHSVMIGASLMRHFTVAINALNDHLIDGDANANVKLHQLNAIEVTTGEK
jgi:hypothetical protein